MKTSLNWFESGAHVLTFLVSVATLVGVASGAIIAEIQYEPYGIHFLEMADVDDYVRVAVKHVALLMTFVVVAFVGWLLWRQTRNGRVHPVLSGIAVMVVAGVMVYSVPRYIKLFDIDTELHDSDDQPTYYDITYGFKEIQVRCLTYITRTGRFLHYWDQQSKTLVSVNESKVSTVQTNPTCL